MGNAAQSVYGAGFAYGQGDQDCRFLQAAKVAETGSGVRSDISIAEVSALKRDPEQFMSSKCCTHAYGPTR